MKNFFFILSIYTSIVSFGQNVGINSTGSVAAASAMFDIDVSALPANNKKGLLIPRVALTSTAVAAPVILPARWLIVFNTDTQNDVTPGFYYWNSINWVRLLDATNNISNMWKLAGNSNTDPTNNFLGTTDNISLRFRTNNTERFEMNTNGQLLGFDLGDFDFPTYSWVGDENTGIYSPGQDVVNIVTGGLDRMRISANGNITMVGTGGSMPSVEPSAQLHIEAPDRGLLIPNIALTARNVGTPIANPATSLLVYNTATSSGMAPYDVVPGFYYWNSINWVRISTDYSGPWTTLGNSGTNPMTNFIGTTDNVALSFRTNNSLRFMMNTLKNQLLSNGQGAETAPTYSWVNDPTTGIYNLIAGQLSFATSSKTALTFFSDQHALFSSYSTSSHAAIFTTPSDLINGKGAIYASNSSPLQNGSAYRDAFSNFAICGEISPSSNKEYSFGVIGQVNNQVKRTGGIIGVNVNGMNHNWCSLAYTSNNGNLYGAYSNITNTDFNSANTGYLSDHIATGFAYGGYSDFVGSIIHSEIIGTINTGKLMASYNVGNEYTSGYQADVVSTENGDKKIAFTLSSTELEIFSNGYSKLQNGEIFVSFNNDFKSILNNAQIPVITATPIGECNGIYISKIEKDGFWVKELSHGNSSVQFSWIAIGKRIDQVDVPTDILKVNFDKNISNLAPNENNPDVKGNSAYWNGKEIIFNQPPPKSEIKKRKEIKQPLKP